MGQSAESPTLQIGLNAAALNGNDFKIALVVAKGDLTGKEANPAGQAASINKAVETYVLGTISAAALPIKNYGSVSKNAGTITFLNSGSAGMDNTTWIPEGNLDPQS